MSTCIHRAPPHKCSSNRSTSSRAFSTCSCISSWSSLAALSSLALRSCFNPLLILIPSTFESSAKPSDTAQTSISLVEISLHLLTQVIFFSFLSRATPAQPQYEKSLSILPDVSDSSICPAIFVLHPRWGTCQLGFECQFLEDHPALFRHGSFQNCPVFSWLFDSSLRLEGDEDGDIEPLIMSLETTCATHLRYVLIFIHRKGRLHCHRHEAEERPQPLISLFASQSLSDDLHNTERTDLKEQTLGVCILPKDKVNVA